MMNSLYNNSINDDDDGNNNKRKLYRSPMSSLQQQQQDDGDDNENNTNCIITPSSSFSLDDGPTTQEEDNDEEIMMINRHHCSPSSFPSSSFSLSSFSPFATPPKKLKTAIVSMSSPPPFLPRRPSPCTSSYNQEFISLFDSTTNEGEDLSFLAFPTLLPTGPTQRIKLSPRTTPLPRRCCASAIPKLESMEGKRLSGNTEANNVEEKQSTPSSSLLSSSRTRFISFDGDGDDDLITSVPIREERDFFRTSSLRMDRRRPRRPSSPCLEKVLFPTSLMTSSSPRMQQPRRSSLYSTSLPSLRMRRRRSHPINESESDSSNNYRKQLTTQLPLPPSTPLQRKPPLAPMKRAATTTTSKAHAKVQRQQQKTFPAVAA